jgi:transposase
VSKGRVFKKLNVPPGSRGCRALGRTFFFRDRPRHWAGGTQRAGARLLLTHPRVGPATALATDVFLGDPQRFADGKALASYVGLIPREYSSGARQRLGALGQTRQSAAALSLE